MNRTYLNKKNNKNKTHTVFFIYLKCSHVIVKSNLIVTINNKLDKKNGKCKKNENETN